MFHFGERDASIPPDMVAKHRELMPQMPVHGTSLLPTFGDAGAKVARGAQYFEMFGHRALVLDGWKAVSRHKAGTPYDEDVWELYELAEDNSEIRDLAAAEPERVAQLDARWWELAEQYDWTIDHMDRDFFVAHTRPAWWSTTWGEQIFVAHDSGGIWINSINDLGKRSSIVSFGYTRRNIRRVTEAITAQEKDIHSPI